MSFDRLAPHYTWLEKALAGPRLQRCRIRWLDELAGCRRLLIAGVGHGHCLAAYARRFPALAITSVDASAAMLAAARERARGAVPNFSRLEFIHATLPAWSPPVARYDAIATHFFLDCFPPEELAQVVGSLSRAARPQASWLLSDFTVPGKRGWAQRRARAIHAAMYAFFRPVTGIAARRVTPPDDLLRTRGFSLARRQHSEWGLLHADLWTRH